MSAMAELATEVREAAVAALRDHAEDYSHSAHLASLARDGGEAEALAVSAELRRIAEAVESGAIDLWPTTGVADSAFEAGYSAAQDDNKLTDAFAADALPAVLGDAYSDRLAVTATNPAAVPDRDPADTREVSPR